MLGVGGLQVHGDAFVTIIRTLDGQEQTIRRGLLAVLGLAAILAGLPWLLLAVHHIGSPRLGWTLQGLRDALLSPDDGTLAFTLLKIVGWIVWAILTIAIAVELWAQLQRHPAPRLRGLRLHSASPARWSVRPPHSSSPPPHSPAFGHPGLAGPATPAQVQESASHEHPSIQRHNQPHLARGSVTTYTVKKGDTLSAIALAKTGRAANYPRIFDASTAIRQPGGRHLSDPDEIDIGWTLKIPKLDNTEASPETPRSERTTGIRRVKRLLPLGLRPRHRPHPVTGPCHTHPGRHGPCRRARHRRSWLHDAPRRRRVPGLAADRGSPVREGTTPGLPGWRCAVAAPASSGLAGPVAALSTPSRG